MKIDRLLAIIIYLLNRKTVSARELAGHFEVSVRTIQRDIDSLCLGGIPIYAEKGSSGGYGIEKSYTLDKQIITGDDFFFISTALKSLCSAYDNKKIVRTLEKMKAMFAGNRAGNSQNESLYVDFTSFREPKNIKENFTLIEQGLQNKTLLEFDYTSAQNQLTHRIVEPMTIVFKWYAWYLLAYCRERSDYRLFSISRIRQLQVLEERFTRKKLDPVHFFEERDKKEGDYYFTLKIIFDNEIKITMETIFSAGRFTKVDDRRTGVEVTMPRNQQYWLGLIMSFGNKITIVEPDFLKDMLVEKASEIVKLYRR